MTFSSSGGFGAPLCLVKKRTGFGRKVGRPGSKVVVVPVAALFHLPSSIRSSTGAHDPSVGSRKSLIRAVAAALRNSPVPVSVSPPSFRRLCRPAPKSFSNSGRQEHRPAGRRGHSSGFTSEPPSVSIASGGPRCSGLVLQILIWRALCHRQMVGFLGMLKP